jgi:hypothetical protein
VDSFTHLLHYSMGRATSINSIGGWVGPRTGIDAMENRNISSLPWNWTSIQCLTHNPTRLLLGVWLLFHDPYFPSEIVHVLGTILTNFKLNWISLCIQIENQALYCKLIQSKSLQILTGILQVTFLYIILVCLAKYSPWNGVSRTVHTVLIQQQPNISEILEQSYYNQYYHFCIVWTHTISWT